MSALVADGALWVAIPLAMLAGLVSFVSPCVLPLVPGYLGFIGAAAAPRGKKAGRGRLVGGVALFIAGFTLVFMVVNILGGTLGAALLPYNELITRVLGAAIILLGFVFVGFFGIAQRTLKPSVRGGVGLIGAPLLGIAMGIGWAPCIGPTLAIILGMSFNQGSASRGAVLGLAYSLGLGIPFLLIALGFGWATGAVAVIRRHIRVVNIAGGILLILVGLAMLTGLWTSLMIHLQGVFASVPLPI